MKIQEIRLKPCPFCGNKAKYFDDIGGGWRYVACVRCGCRTAMYPPCNGELRDIAVARWNKRADEKQEQLSLFTQEQT